MSPPLNQPETGTIAHELALLRYELKANTAETREVKHLLTGSGDPAKGLVVRMDRLEQTELRRNVLVGTAITAGVTALVATAWAKLTGKA